jgi:hypothetical protein
LYHQFYDDALRRQADLRAEAARSALLVAARGGRPPVLRLRVAEWLHAVANRLEARPAVRIG